MLTLQLTDLVTLTQGRLVGEDLSFSSVSTDTRTLKPGDLFIALTGPNFNGNRFAMRAMSLGACAVVVDHELPDQIPQVIVNNTLEALQQLSQAWRMRSGAMVVGVTGSNGKTTVKEMIASVLSTQGKTLKTQGNFNNHIGVPLTLLRLQEEKLAVVEMGASASGEIATLAALVRPNIGVVTNCAQAHLVGFGSHEGVAKAKGELFESLSEDGVAIINRDDPFAAFWLSCVKNGSVISFGFNVEADVTAEQNETGQWQISTPVGSFELKMPLTGKHNVSNAMAAAAVGVALGINSEEIAFGLEQVQPVIGRLTFVNGVNGSQIIDDTYNANPASFAAAIDVLVQSKGEHWMVIGDMAELGENADEIHADLGLKAREAGVDYLYACGEKSRSAAASFGLNSFFFEDQEDLIKKLSEQITGDVTVLVKGSRAMKMERVVEALSDSNNNNMRQSV